MRIFYQKLSQLSKNMFSGLKVSANKAEMYG